MASISTLSPRLQEIQCKLNTLSLDVQRLKDQLVNAGEIPADAEALLSNISSTLDAIAANAQLPSPSPLP